MKADNPLIGHVEISEAIIGAAFEVSNKLGCGFLERVYENALAVELRGRHHDVEQQKPMEVWYKGHMVGMYQADMLVDGEVIVELKAVTALDRTHRSQCLNYLKAIGKKTGLVINFGPARIDVQRVIAPNA
jgi:GxxExxY protein